ncbi:MAG: type VI secretion protein IcmF/TssM N-terminal domain-containing protein [Planctomycetaceae bacterium]
MLHFFYKAMDWLRLICGVVPKSAIVSPKLYLAIHYTAVAVVFILLSIFSDGIRRGLGIGEMGLTIGWMNRIWCGLVFLVIYAIVRVLLYLSTLLGIEEESEFTDIDRDWHEALDALDRERLYIDELPLFLVNGLTPQQEQSAFDAASGIQWKVVAPPVSQTSAVLRVYAHDDAIFISCTGIGTTNCQHGSIDESNSVSGEFRGGGTMMALPGGVTATQQAGSLKPAAVRPPQTGTGTIMSMPDELAPAPAAVPTATMTGTMAGSIGGFFGTMSPGSLKKAMQTFSGLNTVAKGYGKKRLRPISEIDTMVGIRRMQHLCRLISESRRPYCPINGMLQAVPISWASDQDYARRLAPAIRDDLVTVHEAFQLQFPVVALITELDALTGMKEFLLRAERMQPGLRKSRAGSRFAAGAEINDGNAGWVVDRAMQWFRGWVYTAFSNDVDNKDNPKLFHMLCEISQRKQALVTLLRESLYRIVKPGVRLHGCYFAATGKASTEQGFVRGVLDRLNESEADVAWTPQLERSQSRARLLSGILFAAAALLMAANVWIFITKLRGEGQ